MIYHSLTCIKRNRPDMYRRTLSLNALRVFEAAARRGSFKLAAGELHLSQSAVSRQIRGLEEQVGAPLFHRSHRAVTLSPEGETLWHGVSRALAEIGAAAGRIAGRGPDPASRRIVVATTPGIAECWLGSRLGGFFRAHPEIQPEVTVTGDALGEVRAGRADAALHFGGGDWPRLRHDMLIELHQFPVCSPRLLERGPPLRELRDLERHTLLHWTDRRWWGEWLEEIGAAEVDWSRGVLLRDYSLCMQMAEAGEGVALGDEIVAGDRLMDGRLVKPLGAAHPLRLRMHLLSDPASPRDAAVQAFRQWLLAEMDRHVEATRALREPRPYPPTPSSGAPRPGKGEGVRRSRKHR